jgi:cytochrome d ubiquinol oxidase subunit I
MDLSNLMAARMQMAFTLGWHIIIACMGVGLPVLLLYAEARWVKTRDPVWLALTKRWSKGFAVLFAAGAVSGTVLSFELGLLWPEFMGTYGAVIGFPFTMEGFAFFLEAIFVGIYLYGWNKLSPRAHWWSGVPIAISGFMSAWFVVTANAWMNTPRGFNVVDGKITDIDPIAAMFNPMIWSQTTHMNVAAYMVAGFTVASLYAVLRLRGNRSVYVQKAMMAGLVFGCICAPLQALVGDWSAKEVAKYQPVKLAAMEGHFKTERGASLAIGGLPDEAAKETRFAIKIPYLLSILAFGDPHAEVKGLEEFPEEDWPPVPVVHIAFQIMVGLGTALIALGVWLLWSWWRTKALPASRIFLWCVALSGPAAILAMEAGWVVTEVGRQPWIVQGHMRTVDAVTDAPGIWWVFAATMAIYAVLTVGIVTVLRVLASQPLPEGCDHVA